VRTLCAWRRPARVRVVCDGGFEGGCRASRFARGRYTDLRLQHQPDGRFPARHGNRARPSPAETHRPWNPLSDHRRRESPVGDKIVRRRLLPAASCLVTRANRLSVRSTSTGRRDASQLQAIVGVLATAETAYHFSSDLHRVELGAARIGRALRVLPRLGRCPQSSPRWRNRVLQYSRLPACAASRLTRPPTEFSIRFSNWMEESGMARPLHRNFADPTHTERDHFADVVRQVL
jgi:hypothetical protein